MSGINGKTKLSALLMATLMTVNIVCADTYKNNVVDVRVNKESTDAVKVTIYTDKPYTEPVVVNKKANNKYIILMPETKSTLKSSPTLSNLSGTVSDVSVNTQSVSGGKGYTKIIITSEKAITVIPRTQQLLNKSTSTTAASKPAAAAKPAQTAANATKPATAATSKPATAASKTTTATKPATKTATTKPTTTTAAKTTQQKQAKPQTASTAANKSLTTTQKTASKPAAASTKPADTKKAATPAPVEKKAQTTNKEPIKILEQEIKNENKSDKDKFTQNGNDSVLNKEIKDNIDKKEKKLAAKGKKPAKSEVFDANDNKKSIIQNLKSVLKDYQELEIWKLLLLAGAIGFPIIVIMVILGLDKKINRRIDKMRREKEMYDTMEYADTYTEQYDEPTVSYEVEQNAAPVSESVYEEDSQTYNSFDDMLSKVEEQEPAPSYHEEQFVEYTQDVSEPVETEAEPEINSSEPFNNDFADTDFEPDFEGDAQSVNQGIEETIQEFAQKGNAEEVETGETDNLNAVVEPVETIKSVEPEVEYNPEPVAEPEPEIEEEVKAPETELAPYNPDGYLSDFNKINDKDFFEELALQSMAANNTNGLPEELPADEIFNFITEDEDVQASQPEANESIDNPTENIVYQEFTSDDAESTSDDDLTMLTEVKLNDDTGIYLVNYENFSSLVGHIKDDYFVIKKFDDIENGKIFLKETERLKDATRYLVRVGKNKMVVEVSDTSMSRLLDL